MIIAVPASPLMLFESCSFPPPLNPPEAAFILIFPDGARGLLRASGIWCCELIADCYLFALTFPKVMLAVLANRYRVSVRAQRISSSRRASRAVAGTAVTAMVSPTALKTSME